VIEPIRRQYAPEVAIELIDGRAHQALAACDVALVASGTATLEAALFKRPLVVVYAMHAISWQMGKRMHYQPWISLPNILLRDFAVPELLQRDASPEKIAAAAFKWLDDPAACEALRVRFQAVHRELSATPPGSRPMRSRRSSRGPILPSPRALTTPPDHARQDLLPRREAASDRRRQRADGRGRRGRPRAARRARWSPPR
jgi:lipid A disaccharide synthetase